MILAMPLKPPPNLRMGYTSYSDKIYDRLPTNFSVTQYIRVIGNQIASASLPVLEVFSGSELFC